MQIFTVTSTDDLEMEPLSRCVAGSYTERDRAITECVKYVFERIALRGDITYSMAHDENHPEAAEFFSRRRADGAMVVRRGCTKKLWDYVRGELDGQGCYYVYDGRNSFHFDVDENGLEGQLWTTVTWGDSDTEDSEFTTPCPVTFVSKEKAIENFYQYALDLKQQHGIEVSDGFRPWVYDTLEQDGKCQVDLDDGCCVSCVLYSTPADGICK